MRSAPDPRTAVVFSGGASYGAYEVGVMKALVKGCSPSTSFMPLDPGVLCGTSAGAFNAAVLTSRMGQGAAAGVSDLETIWLEDVASTSEKCGNGVLRYRADPFNLVSEACDNQEPNQARTFLADARSLLGESVRRTVDFFQATGTLGQRALELIDLQAFISGEPYVALVQRTVDLDAIRNSERLLRIAATDWQTGAVRVFGNSDMTFGRGYSIVAASGAVPGIFPAVEIDGVPYVDGGVLLNTPLRPAIEAGADTIHLISVNPELSTIPLPQTTSTVNTFYRLMAVSLAGAVNRDVEIAARLNDGIEILNRAQRGEYLPGLPMQALVMSLGGLANRPIQSIPYRRLTVHRYQLGEDFGNFLQWLDFDRDRLAWLIEQGTRDAIAHDCVANGCVLR